MKRAQILKYGMRCSEKSSCTTNKLYISNIEVLTESETAILENVQHRKRIEKAAKDLYVDWAVETTGNVSQIVISKAMDTPATDQDFHELEMKTANFMKVVHDIIEEEKQKKSEGVFEGEKVEFLQFCKKLLERFESNDNGVKVCGAVIMEKVDFLQSSFPAGQINDHLFKELLESYIKTHSHE